MPWIKKIESPKKEKPHHCKIPGVSRDTRLVDPGSIWECKKCGTIWKVIEVIRPFDDGKNYTMTWSTGSKMDGDFQKVTRLDSMYNDI